MYISQTIEPNSDIINVNIEYLWFWERDTIPRGMSLEWRNLYTKRNAYIFDCVILNLFMEISRKSEYASHRKPQTFVMYEFPPSNGMNLEIRI